MTVDPRGNILSRKPSLDGYTHIKLDSDIPKVINLLVPAESVHRITDITGKDIFHALTNTSSGLPTDTSYGRRHGERE
jgi:hypothetical protein